NRLKDCQLEDDAKLKERGRGSLDYRVDENSNILVIKWQDNEPVHLLSTYAGIDPQDTCKRWDGRKKRHVQIKRPFAVKEYNKFMGGVDLCEMLLELYRIDNKSTTKWYMRIFYYLLDLSIVNGWLLYRRVCKFTAAQPMSLVDFKLDIANCLTTPEPLMRRRIRADSDQPTKKRRRVTKVPSASSRLDNAGHFPVFVDKKRRCKRCTKGQTKIWCEKCNVGLCLTTNRNCFLEFHSKL
ncbi:UNVERIFIED_CONTAM: hypothetical protein GTU68_050234, partial [Idotea baltica]|nr:hypothetical protein [Idotea baltica]